MVEVGGHYQQQKVFLLSTPHDVDNWRQTPYFCLGQSNQVWVDTAEMQVCPRVHRNWNSHERVSGALITPVFPETPAFTSTSSPFFLSLGQTFSGKHFGLFFLSDLLSLLVGCSSVSCPHFPQFVFKLTFLRVTVAVAHWPWCGYLSRLSLFFSQEKILETPVKVSTGFWYVFLLAYEGLCFCASRGKKWPLLRHLHIWRDCSLGLLFLLKGKLTL